MSGQDAAETLIAGTGDIHIAPVGTPLPATESAVLNAAFVTLGFTNEDGLKYNWAPEFQEFKAWQSRQPIRKSMTAQDFTLAFSLLQFNAENIITAFGGGEVTQVSAGHFRYDHLGNDDQVDEVCVVADFSDGDKKYRWIAERVTVNDGVEMNLVRTALAELPIALKVLETTPFFLTNDLAWAPAGS